jgi:peptidoglycan hydrolase-like protein with peptidoglycan-binding domain
MTRSRQFAALALAAVAALGLGACSKDDSSSTTTTAKSNETTTTTATEARTVVFDKSVQQQLADVGCHPGAVDGVLGAQTDAAIKAFQEASGLQVDGELGPETEAALKKDVAEGKKVCSATTTTTAKSGSTTTTAATNGEAPCTASALMGGLPAEGEKIGSYVCDAGYAGGSLTDGTKFLLQSKDGKWYAPSQDPCGSASAGIDPKVLSAGCPT